MQTQGLQLYVNDEQVDLHDNESISLTQSIQNLRDIKKVFVDFTQTFNVPASKTNNKIFKHFYNFNILGFDGRKKQDSILHLNYKPFKKGQIKLEGVQMKNNKPENYRVTFFGDTIQLKDLVGEDKLDALVHLKNIDIDYTSTSIINMMETPINVLRMGESFTDVILTPLITHTERLIYNSGDDTAGSGNLHVGSNVKGVKFEQLKPAIRVYYIVRAIEDQYGFKFSTDFFSKTNSSFYNLYMWMHRRKGNIIEDADNQRKELTIKNFSDFQFIRVSNNEFAGQSHLGFRNRVIKSTKTVKRVLHVRVTTGDSSVYTLIIRHNDIEFFSSAEITGSADSSVIQEMELPNDNKLYTFHFETAATQAATFTLEIEVIEVVSRTFGGKRTLAFKATGSATSSTAGNFNASREIPEIKVIDFLTGLFQMFNLTAQKLDTDNGVAQTGKYIKVQTLDNFYASSTKSHDITKHLDKKSSEVNAIMPYNQINLGFKGQETFFAASHHEKENDIWGTLHFKSPVVNDDGSEEDLGQGSYSIELPFEHMKFERLFNVTGGTATTIQWGWSVDLDQSSVVGKPLLFYAHKVTSGTQISIQIDTSTKTTKTNYFIPSNQVDPTDTTLQSPSLHFNSERGEYLAKAFKNTLFETYYKTYIVDTFKLDRRLTKVKAYLPISVISDLKLQDIIVIFTNTYKINTITTNFETGLSSLELINVISDVIFVEDQDEIAENITQEFVTIDSELVRIDNTRPLI